MFLDEIRPEAALSVNRFQDLGIEVAMVTGDATAVAQEVCTLVGIAPSWCHSRLLPVDKLRFIQETERAGQRVMMIGDGINDAAALAGGHFLHFFRFLSHVIMLYVSRCYRGCGNGSWWHSHGLSCGRYRHDVGQSYSITNNNSIVQISACHYHSKLCV